MIENFCCVNRCYVLNKFSNCYQVVRKVRATHVLFNCGKIIITFIECTDLREATTRCQQSYKLCRPLQKSSELRSVK